LILFIVFLFFLSLIVKRVLFFWSLFLILTIVFIFLIKSEEKILNIVNYFIIQEVRGLIFLFLKGFLVQIRVIFLKVGVSPIHFWVFSILSGLRFNLIFWFLTFQKLVYLSILINWGFSFIYFLFFGILICFFQVLFLFDFLKIFVISLTERLNWILVFFINRFFESLFLVVYYLILIRVLLKNNLKKISINWLLIFFLLNLPLSFTFFIKVFILLSLVQKRFIFLVFILFFIVISVLGLIKILVSLNLNLKLNNFFFKRLNLVFFQFLVLFYCFSKKFIILSW
jgi:hypothetical protein